jgi:hypothetical protein
MLARRLALFVALAALLALIVFLATRGDGGIDRSGAAPDDSVEAANTTQVDLASDTSDVQRAAAAPIDAAAEAAAAPPTGRTFAQLVRPYADDTRETPADTTIVCTTAEGVQRRARLADDVLTSDLAPGGLWIVTASDYLPSVFDASYVATLAPDVTHLPLVLRLLPRAQVVLQLEAGAVDGLAIERLALVGHSSNDLVPDWIREDPPPTRQGTLPIHAVASDVVRLAQGVDVPADAAAHVARIRATPIGSWGTDSSLTYMKQDEYAAQLWSPRMDAAKLGTRVAFEHVVAGEELSVATFGLAALVFTRADGSPLAAYSRRGGVGTLPFVLERGERREYLVRHVAPAAVRGRFPAATLAGAQLTFVFEQPTMKGDRLATVEEECEPPAHDVDGSFEWAGLDPGTYELYAAWEEEGAVSKRVHHAFELRPGEVRDFGELRPAASGRLTLHPRLMSDAALAPGRDLPNDTVELHVFGPIAAVPPTERLTSGQAWTYMRRVQVAIDEASVIDGIEPGTYHVVVKALGRKGAPPRSLAADQRRAPPSETSKSGFDPELAVLVNAERSLVVDVAQDTHFDVPIEVAAAGACTLVVPLPAIDERRLYDTSIDFIRSDGLVAQSSGRITTDTSPAGSVTATALTHLAPGEWIAIVAHDVLKDQHGPAVSLVGRSDVTIASGVESALTVAIEVAARVRLVVEGDPDTTPRLAELGDREHVGVTLRSSASGHVFDGLLPHTRYRFGERVIETGPPGSEVVLE